MTSTTDTGSPAMDAFWENVRTILYALALAMLIRFTVAQPYRIPSGSMQPTLEVGDYIVVTKWSYGYGRYSFAPLERMFPGGRLVAHMPKRGDIVVFRPAPDPDRDFVKRLVGLPGDRIRVTNGVLFINDAPVRRQSLGLQPFEEASGEIREVETYRETLPNGVSYLIFAHHGMGNLNDTREFSVPEGSFFMMGDDRDNSEDSRTPEVGFVPFDNLVGPAQFVIA
ncbi:MAG: signal peptidase I, partial [Hyphomonadaceae bacterium]